MDSMCGGVGFIDFDRDGWEDVVLLNGSTLQKMNAGPSIRLYRNNHDLTFTDVTAQVGIVATGWAMGVAVADYDNDGFDDLYITFVDHAVLLHNDAGKHFTDVTAKAGVGNQGHWGTSAAFGDYDNDGFVDLYVANYVDIDLKNLPAFGSSPFCQYRGIKVSCGPRGLKGGRDRLFHNNGDGTFTDVTNQSGIDQNSYYGLGVVWLDYDGDGCQDIYVADDSSPSMLYKGDCHGHFKDVALEAGVAYSSDGLEQAGMGVDVSDFDRDGWLDIAKTNFSDDTNNLYRNLGNGQFEDVNGSSGFGPVSKPFLGFGLKFFDFDNDGWPDVLVANGHVNPQVEGKGFGVTYRERNLLFHNLQNGRFEEMGERAGSWLRIPRVGRGLAIADIDNDGRMDILISNLNGSPILAHNTAVAGHAILLRLIGSKSNRSAIGARVEVVTSSLTQIDEVRANSSYLSASDLRLHFGTGKYSKIDHLLVKWPSGTKQRFDQIKVDQEVTIDESKGIISEKPF